MAERPRRSNPERRWLLLSHLLVAVTLGIPTIVALVGGPAGTSAVTVAIALGFAAWYTAMYALHPQWRERPGVMTVYAVGALTLFTLLYARETTYLLLLYSLLPQFFSVLPRGLAVLGVVAIVLLPPLVRGELTSVLSSGDAAFSLLATVGLGLVVTAIIEALGRQAEEQQETIGQLEAARSEISDLLTTARRDLRERDALARMGSALIAAHSAEAVAMTLAQHLADHSAGVRGVALLATLGRDRDDAIVLESVAGTVAPPPGSRMRLPARWAESQDEIAVIAAEDVAPHARPAVGPGAVAVALLSMAETVAIADDEVPGLRQTVEGPGADVLWLTLGTRQLTEGMRRDLLTVANQTALALANLRLAAHAAERGRTAGILEERQRLAHEIHDTLAQGFTSIVTQLEAADQSREADPPRAAEHLDRARRTARDSLREARRTVEALRPESLERALLPDALRDVATRWEAVDGDGAHVNVIVDGTPTRNAPQIDTALLRVAQEALTNVARHARADAVDVTLAYLDDVVLLDIQDNGTGFEAANRPAYASDVSTGGYGLVSMRERITAVGGELLVESRPGEGTTVAARAPLITASFGHQTAAQNELVSG